MNELPTIFNQDNFIKILSITLLMNALLQFLDVFPYSIYDVKFPGNSITSLKMIV